MHQNPNKFLTVLFSFIPGAGHMYYGLMKRGVSFMAAFFATILGVIFFSRVLSLFTGIFVFAIPLVWFISFFDFWRFPRMSLEDRLELKDEFLMLGQLEIPKGPLLRKAQVIAGVLLVLGGISQLYNQFFMGFLMDRFWHGHPMIQDMLWRLPRLGGALLIIIVGVLLIVWKGKQIKKEAGERYDEE